MHIRLWQKQSMWLVALAFLANCTTISPFNQKAYEQATSLKVEALALMDKAITPYATQKQSVDALKLNMEKAYEYVKGLPQNEETANQWAIIKDPSRHSLGGFLKRWEEKSTLGYTYIQEAKGEVSEAFDSVIGLESGKKKADTAHK